MSEEMMGNVGAAATEETAGAQSKETDQGEREGVELEKKYTDADVDRIVKKKIANERKRMQKLFEEGQQLSELETRERDVLRRELRLDAMEMLMENDVPMSLLDLLNYDSKESMEKSFKCISEAFRDAVGAEAKKRFAGATPKRYETADSSNYAIKQAFSPKAR